MTHSRSARNDGSRQARTLLLAADNKHSIIAEITRDRTTPIAYSPYGQQSGQQTVTTGLGFNGELREVQLRGYLLGNGYRAYNLILMRFHSPDSWSPFGRGGLNAYMYCAGDPVNFSDPTGHIKWPGFFPRPSTSLNRTSSTSSVATLVSRTAATATPLTSPANPMQRGINNPTFLDGSARPTTPLLVRKRSGETSSKIPDHAVSREAPPPIPPKRQLPRFNDTGGQVGILSPNQKPGEPSSSREIWKSTPYEPPLAPVPPPRTLPSGATRYYSVTYDLSGNPTQRSVQKVSLSTIQSSIRARGK
jgi:RHS repeat-associated protein